MQTTSIDEKVREAEGILKRCVGRKGVWASAAELGYKNICFTRDLAIGIEGLVAAGLEDAVQRHLEELRARQKPNGSIKVWFADSKYSYIKQKLYLMFVKKQGVWMVAKQINRRFPGLIPKMGATNDTTDSELHYIDALDRYSALKGGSQFLDEYTESMHRAFKFAQRRIKDGLYRGADWRDNLRFPNDVALLSNNVLLFRAYNVLGLYEEAEALKARIQEQFWNGSYHADQPGSANFDSFGQALAVLHGIATPEQYAGIARKFESMLTPFGLKANDLKMPSDITGGERISVERVNQYAKAWAFIEWYSARALIKMGMYDLARRVVETSSGFDEWRDTVTGKSGGSRFQMWSAALYPIVCREMKMIKS